MVEYWAPGYLTEDTCVAPAPLFFSDVVIISMGKECFPADLGVTGIKKWLNAH